jgi:cation:H+ antiporter
MLVSVLILLAGLAVLVLGADLLVRGAAGLAARLGISPLIVGLTIVAFGTSAPEVAVSLKASFAGQPDIAVGNVVGSNIFNILFILGVSAVITPLVVHQKMVRVDVPIMIGASILMWALCRDGTISRTDGAILFAGIVTYTGAAVVLARRESAQIKQEYAEAMPEGAPGPKPMWLQIALIVGGLVLCVLGAQWLVDASVTIARSLGVSELIIGLTIVAAGTSLPEVATSIVAAIKGQRDIAVGNVVGSNIFNIFSILGITGLVAPTALVVSPAALAFDIPVMIAVALACLPVFFTGHEIRRWEGALFLFAYLAYLAFLILSALDHKMLPTYRTAMLWFALPIAGLGMLASLVGALRPRSQPTP